ncbi:MAG: Apolipoprotein N-acyltransferase / Copper homeostasis protein CutE, partial [uncultured Sphingomonadaceae bacterium]
WGYRSATRSSSPATSLIATTAPISSSTRPTTRGSAAGARPSTWRRRGFAR